MEINVEQLVEFLGRQGAVMLLESQSADHPWSQKTYLAGLPKAIIKARGNRITTRKNGTERQHIGNPWQALQTFRQQHSEWLFGYLGYDLKNHLEDLSSDNWDSVQAPDMYFMVPGFLLEYDHQTGRSKLLKGDMPAGVESANDKQSDFSIGRVEYRTSRARYLDIIRNAQRHITEGDFYEINLSHQMSAGFKGAPLQLYHQMKRVGPVPFGGYLQLDDITICSQSPERFLRKEGSTVISQPIKGTSERGSDVGEDEKLKRRLLSNPKERAENLMIVDLVRNDLSRIARRGTVNVPELFGIQSFGTVHQMVSTVTAEASETDPINILEACFPMGSMTGAPKISAMRTIEELEDYRRGIYSGAIGYITPAGDFDFNVVIRTAIIRSDRLYYSVGGAITSDSDPEKEWDETQVKAKALLNVDHRLQNI